MTPIRAALVLVLLSALCMWSLGFFRAAAEPILPLPPVAAAAADAGEPTPASAEPVEGTAERADRAAAPSSRVALATGIDAGAPGFLGRAVDDEGRPVAGARVCCVPDSEGGPSNRAAIGAGADEVVTAADGRFHVAVPGGAASFVLNVDAIGHTIGRRQLPRPADADQDLGDIVLVRGAIVRGRVVDRQGRPVADARVHHAVAGIGEFAATFARIDSSTRDEADADAARTAADGRFELRCVPVGEFVLTARHPDHPEAASDRLEASAGAVLGDVVLVLEPGAEIHGEVVGAPAGRSLRVWARTQPSAGSAPAPAGFAALLGGEVGAALADAGVGEVATTVAADATFVLRGLEPGRMYQLWVAHDGQQGMPTICSLRSEAPAGAVDVRLRYDEGAAVTCRVVDDRTGAPIERLWLQHRLQGAGGLAELLAAAFAGRSELRACADGRVAITDLRPKGEQTLSLSVEALGYDGWERAGIVVPQQGTIDLGTVRLQPAPRLTVTVLARSDGQPIRGASVRLIAANADGGGPSSQGVVAFGMDGESTAQAGSRAATTDASGRCTINAIVGEPAVLEVSAAGFAPAAAEPFTLSGLDDREREVRLGRGGAVVVRVVGPDGQPIAATVEHRSPSGEEAQLATDAAGWLRVANLQPGEHAFAIDEDAGADGFHVQINEPSEGRFERVVVAEDTETTLELQRRATAIVRGVVREDGVGLAGARVTFLEGDDLTADAEHEATQAVIEGVLGEFGGLAGSEAGTARTDEDGIYELRDVLPGDHRLRVVHRDRVMATHQRVALRPGDNVVDIDLATSIVRGVVRDAAGTPIARAKVRAVVVAADATANTELYAVAAAFGGGSRRMPGEVLTESDGAFELRGVASDCELVVEVRARGFAMARSGAVRVAAGASRDGVAVTLSPAGAIEVRATQARLFAMVTARYVGDVAGVQPVSQLMRGRTVTIDGLIPGRWEVRLQAGDDDGRPAEADVRVVEVVTGATATIDL